MHKSHEWHDIYFQIGDKDYAFRSWPNVPRVGEHVMFHPVDGPVVHEVIRVVWGVNKDPTIGAALTVNVTLKEKAE